MIQFSPPLPKDKRESIKRLGYGLLNKLVLFFNKNFWDTNSDYIGNAP
jgi:monoamine oxidase